MWILHAVFASNMPTDQPRNILSLTRKLATNVADLAGCLKNLLSEGQATCAEIQRVADWTKTRESVLTTSSSIQQTNANLTAFLVGLDSQCVNVQVLMNHGRQASLRTHSILFMRGA